MEFEGGAAINTIIADDFDKIEIAERTADAPVEEKPKPPNQKAAKKKNGTRPAKADLPRVEQPLKSQPENLIKTQVDGLVRVPQAPKEWMDFPRSKSSINTACWIQQFEMFISLLIVFGNALSCAEPWDNGVGWYYVGDGVGDDITPLRVGFDIRHIDYRNRDDAFYQLPVTRMAMVTFNSCLRCPLKKFELFLKRWLTVVASDVLIVQDMVRRGPDLWEVAQFTPSLVSRSYMERVIDSRGSKFYVCLLRPDGTLSPKRVTNVRNLDYMNSPDRGKLRVPKCDNSHPPKKIPVLLLELANTACGKSM
jgi:hypothetical protein